MEHIEQKDAAPLRQLALLLKNERKTVILSHEKTSTPIKKYALIYSEYIFATDFVGEIF
jgi:hypothetical protein